MIPVRDGSEQRALHKHAARAPEAEPERNSAVAFAADVAARRRGREFRDGGEMSG